MLLERAPDEVAGQYDAVVQRIAREHRVMRRTARRWFTEMVRFLDLCAGSATPYAPSEKVDRAWHEFLLFTRDYAAFCDGRYGAFVHHDPYDQPDPEAYERTYVALQQSLGAPPDKKVWPDPSRRRGSCGGGSGCGGDGGCGGGGCGGGGG